MALKIIKAEQSMPVTNLTICLYAPPGLGKTSTAFTSKNPLLLDFDKGAYRSQFRKDTVEINNWQDVESITANDLKEYDTIVIDTVGRALDFLQTNLIMNNPKLRGSSGQLTLQGFGALKASFTTWLKSLHILGKDVILIAHMSEERSGEELVERLDIQGGSKNEVYKVADVMGRIKIDNHNSRVIDFNPSSSGFGKNPAQLEVITIPNYSENPYFFTEIVDKIKLKLNEETEIAKKENERLIDLRSYLEGLSDVSEFNQQLEVMANSKSTDKRILVDVAKSKGLTLNKESKTFEVHDDQNISN